jgi:hypothetical protein
MLGKIIDRAVAGGSQPIVYTGRMTNEMKIQIKKEDVIKVDRSVRRKVYKTPPSYAIDSKKNYSRKKKHRLKDE